MRHHVDESSLDVVAFPEFVGEPEDHQQGVPDREPENPARRRVAGEDRSAVG
jgi:hypothetical protein